MIRFVTLCFICCLGITGFAEEKSADALPIRQMISNSISHFEKAYAERNAESLAKLFTKEAEYVDSAGTVFHGRSIIEAEFAAIIQLTPPSDLTIELTSIRPISENMIVEEGVSSFTDQASKAVTRTRYTATHVKQQDGNWLIASLRELSANELSPHDRLATFNWLLGSWHEDVGGSVITTDWQWSPDGNFLIGEFHIQTAGDSILGGTHRIGWDTQRNQFRSWVFESNGGSAEGWWRPNENGSWSVNLNGVGVDGVSRSSILTYAPDGDQAIFVSQDFRTIDGTPLPNLVHRIVRKPPSTNLAP